MTKTHNRFIIDTSNRGKFPDDVIVHALPPRFIATAMIMPCEAYNELETSMHAVERNDLAYASRELKSGKYLVLIVKDWWDYVEAANPTEVKRATESVKLALKSYYSFILDQVREAGVNEQELSDCIEFINVNLRNSETKFHLEKFNQTEEMQTIYRQNLTVLKWIRKYLKQLWEISLKTSGQI